MKKQNKIYILSFIFCVGIFFGGCKKSTIDSQYYNPETAVTANVPALFAGLFNNAYVIPRYWNLYTLLIPVFGEYSQTNGYANAFHVYEQPTNYTTNKWDNYYTTVMAQYRELQKYYNNLTSPADKQGFAVFLNTADIFFYDQTAQMVDLWGDIPYSAAGSLNAKGTIVPAKYDSAQTIYYGIINDLDRINTYLDTLNLPAFYGNQFSKYDYVNGGNLMKWREYANSLRLRLAMRISYYDSATAKTVVMGMLNNPTQYPMVLNASDAIQINLEGNMISTGNDIRNGFGVDPFAPGYMVDSVMGPANDPRLPFYFTLNNSGSYQGVLNSTLASTVTSGEQNGVYSRWDSTTFTENNNFPGLIIDAAEVNFCIAEAYQRWGSVSSAQTAYYNGINQSILYYYTINSSSSYTGPKQPMPSAGAIAAYEAYPTVAFGTDMQGNLEKIATQKWIDFNVMQANQAWAEYRRTKLPALSFPIDPGSVSAPNPPTRLLYPGEESSLNTANYDAVAAKDNITTKIFWDVK
ncbi:MAG TPA: SusD/RagB family nutrient-binding outer membrane lipoprotein [Hanamia sp.]|nr:SusD/RagB family nutrient-binding outer membrane lipoprotein [Hanamia sp.]